MPEGPELYLASQFINRIGHSCLFGGPIVKSEFSTKNPDVDWHSANYRISASSKGKEMKITLTDNFLSSSNSEASQDPLKTMDIVFRFGMSGSFKCTSAENLPKHSHLRFFTVNQDPQKVLSFVDYRRFGRWEVNGSWSCDRGPDPMWEYSDFRQNILSSLDDVAFNKPICEAMLNQKYFNGIGNYLRAEVLYRCKVGPFEQARQVLSQLKPFSDWYRQQITEGAATFPDSVPPDLLDLCHILPNEVINLGGGGKGYGIDHSHIIDDEDGKEEFNNWLRCYYKDGMKTAVDHNKRTIWFSGELGPLAPKGSASRKRFGKRSVDETIKQEIEDAKGRTSTDCDMSFTKVARYRKKVTGSMKEKVVQMKLDEELVNIKTEEMPLTDNVIKLEDDMINSVAKFEDNQCVISSSDKEKHCADRIKEPTDSKLRKKSIENVNSKTKSVGVRCSKRLIERMKNSEN